MGVAGLPPKNIKRRTPPTGGLGLLGFPMEGKPVQATRKKKRRGRRRRRSEPNRTSSPRGPAYGSTISYMPPRPDDAPRGPAREGSGGGNNRKKGQPPSDVRPASVPVMGQPTGEIVRPPGIPTEIGSPRPSRPPVGRRRKPPRAPEGRRRGRRRRPYTEEREIPIAKEVIMPIEDFGPKGPMPFDPRKEMRVLDRRERKAQRTDSREMKRARRLEMKERRMDR